MKKALNKRELQSIETKNKLLETSIKLIVNKGYDNVSINEICAACNVAKGTFYTYFTSKKEIAVKILSDINDNLFLNRTWNYALSASEQLLEYSGIYLKEIENQGVDFTRVFLSIIIQEKFNGQTVKAHLHQIRIREILELGIKNGEFHNELDIPMQSEYLNMYIFGLMMNWCMANGSYSIMDEGLKAVRFYLRSIQNLN
ncbi:TetR/AcrR family transcriptional regulator [Anaerocolumna sp. MB42-C2]|uniref:TetR/AcrR family transcriptional regulator n=1 Tax=Anaerocolumna sp. MB42-C2 TaxID=3070997 RepID=UPI0027DEBAB4|nr:TetR/AcrR family transcriptional regulator [Anaerocolumna sp. MB42-C2]WMJ85535.1 TetR/AcrR family transcriptional regulator [Anaerocolumna sp. MB42-C2]